MPLAVLTITLSAGRGKKLTGRRNFLSRACEMAYLRPPCYASPPCGMRASGTIGRRDVVLEGRRSDGRRRGELRPVRMVPGFVPPAEGSVLIEVGSTRLICTATVQDSVPPFLRGQGRGWVTAEYAMLPRSSGERIERERRGPGGRTHEIP